MSRLPTFLLLANAFLCYLYFPPGGWQDPIGQVIALFGFINLGLAAILTIATADAERRNRKKPN